MFIFGLLVAFIYALIQIAFAANDIDGNTANLAQHVHGIQSSGNTPSTEELVSWVTAMNSAPGFDSAKQTCVEWCHIRFFGQLDESSLNKYPPKWKQCLLRCIWDVWHNFQQKNSASKSESKESSVQDRDKLTSGRDKANAPKAHTCEPTDNLGKLAGEKEKKLRATCGGRVKKAKAKKKGTENFTVHQSYKKDKTFRHYEGPNKISGDNFRHYEDPPAGP
ncbi:hypothetical protein APHAL10511_003383 [Amanita phalloides]|nr:hypothetical protein APHAL10511_003383 [Amanita phalloides]